MGTGKKPKKVVNPEDFLPLGENDRHIRVVFHGKIPGAGQEEWDTALHQLLTSTLAVELNVLGESSERFLLSEAISNHDSVYQARGGKNSGRGSDRGEGGHGGSSKKDSASSVKALVGDSGYFSCLLSQKRITITLALLRRLCGGFAQTYVSFHHQVGMTENNVTVLNTTGNEAGTPPSSLRLPPGRGKEVSSVEKGLPGVSRVSPSGAAAGNAPAPKLAAGRDKPKRDSAVSGTDCCLEKVQISFEDLLRSNTKRYELHLESFDSVRQFLSSSWVEVECKDLPLLPDVLMRRYYPLRIALHSLDCFEDFLSDEDSDDREDEGEDSEKCRMNSSSRSGKCGTRSDSNRSATASSLQRTVAFGRSSSEHGTESRSDRLNLKGEPHSMTLNGSAIKGGVSKAEDGTCRRGLYGVINCLGHTITTGPLPAQRRGRQQQWQKGCKYTQSLSPHSNTTLLSKNRQKEEGELLTNNKLKTGNFPFPAGSDSGQRFGNQSLEAVNPEGHYSGETKEIFHSIIFLGHSCPLRIYQRVLSEDVTVSIHRHDPQHQHFIQPTEKEGGEPLLSKFFHLGTGSFSLRALVEHRQTVFHESIQMLPNRSSLVNSESTLTSGSSVSLTVEFFQPFPLPEHVNENGVPVTGSFMTRGVLILPYAGDYVEGAMTTFLRELLRSKRAGPEADVRAYEPPPTEEAEEEESLVKKGKRTAIKERSVSDRETKKDSGRRGKQKAKPPTPPPPPPPEVAAFDAPFQVISPQGITGFEVMDDVMRLICLEGPAPEVHHILQATAEACGYPEDGSIKMLYNAELFTPSRLYAQFPPLITRIPRGNDSASMEMPGDPSSPFPSDALHEMSGAVSSPSPGVVLHPDVDPSSQLLDDAEAAVEAEAGGTAGRLHRIRLREPLCALGRERRFLLHRLLSESCLTCIQKLFALSQVHTLWKAVQQHYFPSAVDLIHLERSFGQTLDLQDVLGRPVYSNQSNIMLSEEANQLRIPRGGKPEISRMHEVDVTHLCSDDVGLLISFRGRLLAKAKRVPADVLRRYSTSLWMVTNTGVPVLCAFPREVPGGTIQYMLEGQVVKVGRNTFLLYIMEFHTISNNITTSKNPVYEDFLKKRRQCEKRMALVRRKVTKTLPQRGPLASSAPKLLDTVPCGVGAAYGKNDNSSCTKSSAFSFPFQRVPQGSSCVSRQKDRNEDSEDDSEVDTLGSLPPDDLESSVNTAEAAFAEYWAYRCGPPHITKSTALLMKKNQKPRPTAEDYMKLWERYDHRAKKALPEVPKGPAMHFGKVQ